MTRQDTRSRLAEAALDLFETESFENTTIEQIVNRAGVSKTTFFRHFRSKEEVILPDHNRTIAEIETMFELSPGPDRLATVYAAASHVLSRYVEEGEVARRRYGLTSAVPSLRDAEVASIQLYQRVFRRHLAGGQPAAGLGDRGLLVAEVQAAGVVAANNFVIRRWLRGETSQPLEDFEQIRSFLVDANGGQTHQSGSRPNETGSGATVVVLHTRNTVDDVVQALTDRLDLRPTDQSGTASRSSQA